LSAAIFTFESLGGQWLFINGNDILTLTMNQVIPNSRRKDALLTLGVITIVGGALLAPLWVPKVGTLLIESVPFWPK